MIESMSLRIAQQIKRANPEETPSINIMRYSIKLILLNTITISLIVLSGILIGNTNDVMICLLGFAALRFLSGGYHIQNAWLCAIVSCLIIQANALFAGTISNHQMTTEAMQVITLLLVGIYAPSNIEKITRFKKENYKWLKVISLIMCLFNIFLLKNDLLTLAFFFQGLTLIKFNAKEEVKS